MRHIVRRFPAGQQLAAPGALRVQQERAVKIAGPFGGEHQDRLLVGAQREVKIARSPAILPELQPAVALARVFHLPVPVKTRHITRGVLMQVHRGNPRIRIQEGHAVADFSLGLERGVLLMKRVNRPAGQEGADDQFRLAVFLAHLVRQNDRVLSMDHRQRFF